jgi:hypothetical protein
VGEENLYFQIFELTTVHGNRSAARSSRGRVYPIGTLTAVTPIHKMTDSPKHIGSYNIIIELRAIHSQMYLETAVKTKRRLV